MFWIAFMALAEADSVLHLVQEKLLGKKKISDVFDQPDTELSSPSKSV